MLAEIYIGEVTPGLNVGNYTDVLQFPNYICTQQLSYFWSRMLEYYRTVHSEVVPKKYIYQFLDSVYASRIHVSS
jgi:hypothetical protein